MEKNKQFHSINLKSQFISCLTNQDPNHLKPNLILIHGNSSAQWSFRKQAESYLAEKYTLFILELPGHGDSTRVMAHDAYSIPWLRTNFVNFVTNLNLNDYVLVGHSMGANLALEVMNALPSTKGITFFGASPLSNPIDLTKKLHPVTSLFFKGDLKKQEIHEWVKTCFAKNSQLPLEMYESIQKADPSMRENIGRSIANQEHFNEVELMAKMKIPLAIFHAEHELYVDIEDLKDLKAPTLWQDIKMIKHAGHYAHYEQPDQFNKYLDEFIQYCYYK